VDRVKLLLLLLLLLSPPCQCHTQAAHQGQDAQNQDPSCNDQQQLQKGAEWAIPFRGGCKGVGGVGGVGVWLQDGREVAQDADGASIIQPVHTLSSCLCHLQAAGPGGLHFCRHQAPLEGP
jgi:hypothetical protein